MARTKTLQVVAGLVSHFTVICCITYPFVSIWRFDLLNPDNKYELDWLIWYILPWDIISLWAWAIAAYRDPGFVVAEHFLPLPEKMDKVDKATLERVASQKECERCKKLGRTGIWKVEFLHHCGACNRCVYGMDHHCPWLDNCAGKRTMKPFLLFSVYIAIFCSIGMYHMTQILWPKFNYKGHGMTSIWHIWYNRLNPKIWELDIWYNGWGLFDAWWFGLYMTTILIGTATFARQMQMQAEWTDPISLLKGELRPYRGYTEGFKQVWNYEKSHCLFWFLPTLAYDEFKIDRMAPEMIIFREKSLQGTAVSSSCGHEHKE